MSTDIGFEVTLTGPFDAALGRVTEVLAEHGFGILTTIDIKKAFAEKLGVDFRPYVILGACNPTLAHRALTTRPEVGLLLPCNVTLEAGPDDKVTVRIADPVTLFAAGGFESDPAMDVVVDEAHGLLEEVAAKLDG
jgi:uncharacterized protein (DUF302 family)